MKLSIFHTPELTPVKTEADCAIAVDVLRATSTIVTALGVGADSVQVFSDLEKLLQTSESWPSDRRIRAGERGGSKVAGFDFGNSPLDCTPDRVGGCRIFMSTTNGTRALQCIEAAQTVLAGALINRHAIVNHLMATQPERVWIVCSGWEGGFSLEDAVCAGAIAHGVQQALGCPIADLAENDEMVSAIALYQQWQNDLVGLLQQATHGQRLLRLDCHEDLKYCAQIDSVDVLPIQREIGVLVKQ